MPSASKLFREYRALGFTTNHIPLAVRYHHKHKENYIVTCVGKAFHTYNSSRLKIVSISNSHDHDITSLAVDSLYVFTAHGNIVQAYSRGRQVAHTYKGHDSTVHLLLPFGQHLISVDEDSCLKVWDIATEGLYIELHFEPLSITTILHPSTYLNKVLIGSQQGALQLWNIRSGKLLYTFEGWKSGVTTLAQAPAIDVVAVGLQSGKSVLHNIKFDETLMTFSQDWGPVTAISFRTDGQPVMATGSPAGHVALWDLEKRKLQSEMRSAHNGAITGLQCLPSEPLMVTSSPDNSIKVWVFDQPDGGGRLLRERSGHSAPPNKIRFHGLASKDILSAGQDSTLRRFSTVHDGLNRSLGRASYNKAQSKRSGLKLDKHMMPPITDFVSEDTRQSDWDSIAACHRGIALVTTWHYQRSTMGVHRLLHERFRRRQWFNATATCITISSCGNYVLIGYSSGHLDVYNIQSGIHRGSFVRSNDTAHKGEVRGVVIDGLNQVVVSAGADLCVNFWRFKHRRLLQSIELESPAAHMALHRESAMLAVALDDFTVVVMDIDTRRVVRKFSGHRNRVTDMTFSADSRWLVTASMDCTVCTWDLPTAKLVDCFLVDSAVTSLTFSSTSDFLATTHVNDVGIYLWSNVSRFTHVALNPLPADYEPLLAKLPTTGRPSQSDDAEDEVMESEEREFQSPEHIADGLVTLSLLPHSRWQNLLNLDVIKKRNKPKNPVRVPPSAPFFLPTVPGLEIKFAKQQPEQTQNKSHVSRSNLQPLTAFGEKLDACETAEQYISTMEMLKGYGPSKIDMELRSLSVDGGGSVTLMLQFLKMITHVLKTNRDFELAQAYLALFLKLHCAEASTQRFLVDAVEALRAEQLEAWSRVQHMFTQSLCMLNYLRGAGL